MEVRGGLFYLSLCSWIVFPVCPFLRISVTQFPYLTQFPCRLTFCPTFCDPVFCCVCAQSRLNSLVNPWTDCTACQAPLSVGFSRQEYCSGLPFPPPWRTFLDEPHCPSVAYNFVYVAFKIGGKPSALSVNYLFLIIDVCKTYDKEGIPYSWSCLAMGVHDLFLTTAAKISL